MPDRVSSAAKFSCAGTCACLSAPRLGWFRLKLQRFTQFLQQHVASEGLGDNRPPFKLAVSRAAESRVPGHVGHANLRMQAGPLFPPPLGHSFPASPYPSGADRWARRLPWRSRSPPFRCRPPAPCTRSVRECCALSVRSDSSSSTSRTVPAPRPEAAAAERRAVLGETSSQCHREDKSRTLIPTPGSLSTQTYPPICFTNP